MHTVFALLWFVVVIHWLIFPYPSGLLHWHCGNLTIAPVPAKQPWWIWINTSCEFIMNDFITTTKQSTTKPCAYFLGYTVKGNLFCNFDKCVDGTFQQSECSNKLFSVCAYSIVVYLVCKKYVSYRQVSNIRRILVGNEIVNHSDVVGASPVGAAPTTSPFAT